MEFLRTTVGMAIEDYILVLTTCAVVAISIEAAMRRVGLKISLFCDNKMSGTYLIAVLLPCKSQVQFLYF